MSDKNKSIAFWKLLVDTEGNPSVSDITNIGFSEGWAVETIIRLSQCSPSKIKKMVEKAKEELAKEQEDVS